MRLWMMPVVALVLVATSSSTRAACDVTGVDAAAIAAGRDAIDAGCPCAAAVSRRDYRRCATDVVNARVGAALLSRGCRRETLKHAKLSICGWPGAAVCCRVRPDGRERHRVVSDAAKCVSSHSLVACVSAAQSVPTGCDATGCIPPPVCGNGVVEQGEDCDPPDFGNVFCDAECHTTVCPGPPPACGNGTLDPGEACEPAGVDACGDDCQLASCATPAAGEFGIACDVASTGVGAAATPTTYLVAWADEALQGSPAILARRYDVNGTALDAGRTILTADAPCLATHRGPGLASDGQDFYAIWSAFGPIPSSGTFFYQAIFGSRVDGVGGAGPLDTHATYIPVGMCQGAIRGPTTAAAVSTARFALGYEQYIDCAGYEDPIAFVADFNPMPTPQSFDLGFPIGPPPNGASRSAASVVQLGTDTMWVWHAVIALSFDPPYEYVVTAAFTDLAGVETLLRLTHRNAWIGGRPSVAAGAASFLVAWSQSASDVATTVTEIRAVRATRAAGSLDPDGGLLLATSATQITGGPVVAFDGTRWLVVWAEASGVTNDLRAVAVEADGTVVDASPRLVASDVVTGEPAVASAGDGRVLVVFARPDGGTPDVLGTFVMP